MDPLLLKDLSGLSLFTFELKSYYSCTYIFFSYLVVKIEGYGHKTLISIPYYKNTNGSISSNKSINVLQEKIQPSIAAAYLAGGSEQPSPVSILEASFSNDSCSMGSFNGSSGV